MSTSSDISSYVFPFLLTSDSNNNSIDDKLNKLSDIENTGITIGIPTT